MSKVTEMRLETFVPSVINKKLQETIKRPPIPPVCVLRAPRLPDTRQDKGGVKEE